MRSRTATVDRILNAGTATPYGPPDVNDTIGATGKGHTFNRYDGSLREDRFASSQTAGDGSVDLQVSRPGSLSISEELTTSRETKEPFCPADHRDCARTWFWIPPRVVC
ncbi:hypothetical protein LVY72_14345 [Arthrobacter sp. I2-34]|uniref:Uncharacterized protein n=1 Tax=Arthrobacter hankyongi TaxID=2904801 RepID=A0ABS9L8T6_9MICC|nr:hypothetical protein [Arthrobacter hankyongi]MCG2623080.1 hypothetical protein [Arthrobacter hankyongi]